MSNGHTHPYDAAPPTAYHNNYNYHEQPGLEVDSRADDTAKQVVADGGYYHPDERHASPGLQAAPVLAADHKYEGGGAGGGGGEVREVGGSPDAGGAQYSTDPEAVATPAKTSRRRLWIILGALAAVIVVVGAVVGGVVGSRAAQSPSSSGSSADKEGANTGNGGSNDTTPATAPLKNIRPGSRLAVTGWREGAGYHVRLFYQGPDQQLRYSTYSSTDPAWNGQPTLLDQMEHKPGVNASLAAATSVESKDITGEIKLIYVDDSTAIRMQIFPQGGKPAGKRGALNDYPQLAAPGSRLGAYWPFVLSQDVGGKLRWSRYWGGAAGHPFWESGTDAIGINGASGTGLVVLPAASRYLDAGGIVYRRADGKVNNYLADRKGNTTGFAWANGDLSSNEIPANSPLAAFTVARSGAAGMDPQNLVNTYILYVGPKGAINMLWQDDNAGWQGPRTFPGAFDGADAGTDLTCLTPAAWDGTGVRIESTYDMARCYFQAGNGRVREVQFDGSNWKDLGYLPID
ncbi:uncharacterized protein PG998_002685 [Apiospora kogelbergensis]|uniref:uncharacterized protein n=1 Tax=Apiospora kogelbergensis TaxID=1337665 RepID=UPI0031308A4A